MSNLVCEYDQVPTLITRVESCELGVIKNESMDRIVGSNTRVGIRIRVLIGN